MYCTLPVGRTNTIRSSISATDHDYVLTLRTDLFFQHWQVTYPTILLGEEIHSEMNTVQFPSFDIKVSWNIRTTRQNNRLVFAQQVIHIHINPNVSIHL